jgi:hypothetical protein
MIRTLGIAVLSLAACAGPSVLPRTEVPPPTPSGGELAPNPPSNTDDAATQQWLTGEVDRLRAAGDRRAPSVTADQGGQGQQPRPDTNDEATKAWLDQTIEQRRAANPDTPPAPLYQTVERTVYVEQPVRYYGGYDSYNSWGEPVYAQRYYRPYRQYSGFPINTAVGAGIGALVSRHHRGRGAAIGAGIGLLFDLAH